MTASNTRALAHHLRSGDAINMAHRVAAATAIDTLLDAIEAGGMVQPRQAPQMDLGPLRELRAWHASLRDALSSVSPSRARHVAAVAALNAYFPEGDRL